MRKVIVIIMLFIPFVSGAQLTVTNLKLSVVLDSIKHAIGETTLSDACTSDNVNSYGLNPTYCPGNNRVERLNNLQTDKILSYFKGYSHSAPAIEPCGESSPYSGGESYPTEQTVNVTTSTGTVTFTYQAISIPDLFLVYYNDVLVINTGYVGSSDFDFGGSRRSEFTSALNGRTDPVNGGTYPNFTNYPDDGYPRIVGDAGGTETFLKNTSIQYSYVEVYAPMSGTGWNYTISCPQ